MLTGTKSSSSATQLDILTLMSRAKWLSQIHPSFMLFLQDSRSLARRQQMWSGKNQLTFSPFFQVLNLSGKKVGLSAGTGKLCIFGHLGLVFIWSCFVSCLLLLLYYVICAPVLTEGTKKVRRSFKFNGGRQKQLPFSLFFKLDYFVLQSVLRWTRKNFIFNDGFAFWNRGNFPNARTSRPY